jgi:hypothetical protein
VVFQNETFSAKFDLIADANIYYYYFCEVRKNSKNFGMGDFKYDVAF